ncbi:MAG: hypothetical protein JWO35_900 [Candidatus Saccharibacteria bacterium]|nr:hypothetical protein [Candidatus Saccharibacteria bacterium]
MYHFELLQKIGLSKTACRCCQTLVTNGPLTAEELSERLKLTVNGLYRVLNRLDKQGFIQIVRPYGHPTRYQAYPVNKALNNYFAYQKQLVRPLSLRFPAEPSKDLRMYRELQQQIAAGKKLTPAQARVAPLFREGGRSRLPDAK